MSKKFWIGLVLSLLVILGVVMLLCRTGVLTIPPTFLPVIRLNSTQPNFMPDSNYSTNVIKIHIPRPPAAFPDPE